MKKYGFVILLVIFCRAAFAEGCYFTANTPTYTFTPVNIQPISVAKNTAESQLVATYSTNGSPALITHYDTNYESTEMRVATSGNIKPLATKTSAGAVLFPVSNIYTGYAFAFKISSGSRSAYITNIDSFMQPLFSNLKPSECDNKKWDITLELWHVDQPPSYDPYRGQPITPLSGDYFRLGFADSGDFSEAYISLSAFSIPVMPPTCDLTVSSSVVDFGELNIKQPDTWPTKEITLTNNNCIQNSTAPFIGITTNGNPANVIDDEMLNSLTGDNAAQGITMWFTQPEKPNYRLDIDTESHGGDIPCLNPSYGSDGFVSSCVVTIIAHLGLIKGTTVQDLKNGDFKTSVTFIANYF